MMYSIFREPSKVLCLQKNYKRPLIFEIPTKGLLYSDDQKKASFPEEEDPGRVSCPQKVFTRFVKNLLLVEDQKTVFSIRGPEKGLLSREDHKNIFIEDTTHILS